MPKLVVTAGDNEEITNAVTEWLPLHSVHCMLLSAYAPDGRGWSVELREEEVGELAAELNRVLAYWKKKNGASG